MAIPVLRHAEPSVSVLPPPAHVNGSGLGATMMTAESSADPDIARALAHEPGDIVAPAAAAVRDKGGVMPPVAPVAQPFESESARPTDTRAAAVEPARPGASPDRIAATATVARARISPLAGILIGAAAGAVAAALASAVLLPRVLQSIDLRVAPVADRIALVETRLLQTDDAIGRLNNEVAQAIDGGSAVAERVSAQTTALADIQRQLAGKQAASAAAIADPSVFAVAVVQLRSAFYSGRPFEAELVNVFTLARGNDHFLAPLNILSAPSRTGVPTAALLRQELPPFVKAAGLRIGQPQTYYDYGLAVVSQYVGFATEPYAIESGNEIVTGADRRLMSGDVSGAVDALTGLDPSLVATFQPWLDAARLYVREESAVRAMTAAVIDGLRQRMGVAATAG
jgi:hypothetical protein